MNKYLDFDSNNIKLCSELLKCKDLYVVLENRFQRKYIESYNLNNIFIRDLKFWAKFKNVHCASGHIGIDDRQSLSYAYNNFVDLVCCFGLDKKTCRYYSSYAYSSIRFITKGCFSKIWSSYEGGDIEYMYGCVSNAHKFKVIIKSKDKSIYILPVHTLEVYEDYSNFMLYTEFDGFPDSIRDYENQVTYSDTMNSKISSLDKDGYPSMNFMSNVQFFSTHFVLNSNTLIHKISGDNGLEAKKVEFDLIEIWVSDN